MINDQREQEWNISRKELLEFVEIGILAEDEIEQATAMKFNPVSCFFATCIVMLVMQKNIKNYKAY